MKILGITCDLDGVAHDNSVALLIDKGIVFAEAEERISRVKHDKSFPSSAIEHTLKFSNLSLDDIDVIAFGIPPIKLKPYLLTYAQGFRYINISSLIRWIYRRLLKSTPNSKISQTLSPKFGSKKIIFISHHRAHAETAYHFSGFSKCLVVAWDGHGIDDKGKPLCGTIYRGENGKLEKLEELPANASLPLYYAAVTLALGFKVNDGEGKTMGLSVYGNSKICKAEIQSFCPYFNGKSWTPRSNWLDINSVFVPDEFKKTKSYHQLLVYVEKFKPENVAAAMQELLEEESEKFFMYLINKYKQKTIACAGGVFLNVKMNMQLVNKGIIKNLFIYPNPTDGGVAVGAAIAAYEKLGGKFPNQKLEKVDLGCEFSDEQIEKDLKNFKNKIQYQKIEFGLESKVADAISKGKVIGWFQGRGEWGPRALGQRSVLADPRDELIKDRINQKLKQRDWFMPFAPAILHDKASQYLVHLKDSPFMITADNVKKSKQNDIKAAIHIDGTARPQLVKKSVHPKYYKLIEEFYKLTGVPVILNTSFNRHGLPIVHSPKEAVEHLLWGAVDELVIGNFLVKRNQIRQGLA